MGHDWAGFAEDHPGLPKAVRKEVREKSTRSRLHRKVRGVDIWVVSHEGTSLSAGGGSYLVRSASIHLRPVRCAPDVPRIRVNARYPVFQPFRSRGPQTGDAKFDRAYRVVTKEPDRALALLTEQVRQDTFKAAEYGWSLDHATLTVRPPRATGAHSFAYGLDRLVRLALGLAGAE